MPQNVGDTVRDFFDDNIHHQTDDALPQQVDEGNRYMQSVVLPAFQEAAQRLTAEGHESTVSGDGTSATLQVMREGKEIFSYSARMQLTDNGAFPTFDARGLHGRLNNENHGHLRPDTPENQGYNVTHITQDELTRHILNAYRLEMEEDK
jgi:hypothetical protein